MNTRTRVIIGYAEIALMIAAVAGLAYWSSLRGLRSVGLGADILDPLLSGNACQTRSEQELRVQGVLAYDWYITPPATALANAAGGTLLAADGATGYVRGITDGNAYFRAPDVNTAANGVYTIEAVAQGSVPNTGSGVQFTVKVAPACVQGIAFVEPAPGTPLTPAGGTVPLNQIRATLSGGKSINYSGADLKKLPVTFDFTEAPGVQWDGTQFKLPQNHGPLKISMNLFGQAYTGDPRGNIRTANDSEKLLIASSTCQNLTAALYEGHGQGFGLVSDQGKPSQSGPLDLDAALASFAISNPPTATLPVEAKVFNLTFQFDDALKSAAEVTQRSDTGATVVKVRRDYDLTQTPPVVDGAKTASNFIYAVNQLLGSDTPIVAFLGSKTSDVILYSTELGAHTNNYLCAKNDAPLTPCMTGGLNPNVPGGQTWSATPPVRLNPLMNQNETKTVFSRGGYGTLKWESSDASIVSVQSLSEAGALPEETPLTGDNLSVQIPLDPSQFNKPGFATVSLDGACTKDEQGQILSCPVRVSASAAFNPPQGGAEITIQPPKGRAFTGQIQLQSATAVLKGASAAVTPAGGVITITAPLLVGVTGDATGTLKGEVSMDIRIESFADPKLIRGTVLPEMTLSALIKDTLTPVISAPAQPGQTAVTNFAVLTGKREGKAQLYVSDDTGCTAFTTLEVKGKKLFVEFADPIKADTLEKGDTLQVRAFTGFPGGPDRQEVTNLAQWESDNATVATVSATGIVTAIGPGFTNIIAHYTPGAPETGTLTSEARLPITVNALQGLTIAPDPATLAQLPPENRGTEALIYIHKSSAVGSTITVEGNAITLAYPAPLPVGGYKNETERVGALADQMAANAILTANFAVSRVAKNPGVLIVRPLNNTALGPNGVMDIAANASSEGVSFLSGITGTLTVPANQTFRMRVVGEYSNGITKRLPNTAVRWIPSLPDVLDQASLDGGALKRGTRAGQITLKARNEELKLESNELSVGVESGPVIERVDVDADAEIVKGSPLRLTVRVSDIDTLADVKEIRVGLYQSAFGTRSEILADPARQFFGDVDYQGQLIQAVTPAPVQVPVQPGGTGTAPATTVAPQAQAPQFKTYALEYEVPQKNNLFDGAYKLVVTYADANGRTADAVVTLFLGKILKGDVNGDGKVDLLDALRVLRFRRDPATYPLSQRDKTAADVAGIGLGGFDKPDGQVDLLDVLGILRILSVSKA